MLEISFEGDLKGTRGLRSCEFLILKYNLSHSLDLMAENLFLTSYITKSFIYTCTFMGMDPLMLNFYMIFYV